MEWQVENDLYIEEGFVLDNKEAVGIAAVIAQKTANDAYLDVADNLFEPLNPTCISLLEAAGYLSFLELSSVIFLSDAVVCFAKVSTDTCVLKSKSRF